MAKAKPVIKVYLLPDEWGEDEHRTLSHNLAGALIEAGVPRVESEDDVLTIFPKDGMYPALQHIHCEVDLPLGRHATPKFQNKLAEMVIGVLQVQLDKAYIQCKVYVFDDTVGFSSSIPS